MKFDQKVINKAAEVDSTSNRGSRTRPKNPYTASKQSKHTAVKQSMMKSKIALAAKINSPESCSSVAKDNCLTNYNEPNVVSPDNKVGLEKGSSRGVTINTSTQKSKSQTVYNLSIVFSI
jgi:hypothetical protein